MNDLQVVLFSGITVSGTISSLPANQVDDEILFRNSDKNDDAFDVGE